MAAGVPAGVLPVAHDDAYYENMIIFSLVFAIGASGLNIIMGFAGYVSLGQGAFIGLGGYTIGVLASKIRRHPLVLGAGRATGRCDPRARARAGVAALARAGLRHHHRRLPVPDQVIATNWVGLTNGTAGLTLPLPTWDRDIINWPFYYALVLFLALQLLMSWWIRRTKLGMGLIAIRDDESKAATIGINLPVNKIIAFVASVCSSAWRVASTATT